jgi:transcriptional regulator with XRE-family HTH domain
MVQIPRLREWRELQGWTQKDLAQESGVSARSIASYEAGGSARPGTARRLAEALNIEVADLVMLGKAQAPPSPEQPSLNGFEVEERRTPDAEVIAGYEHIVREHRIAWREALEALASPWEQRLASGAYDHSSVEQFFSDVVALSQSISRAISASVDEDRLRREYKGLPPSEEDRREAWASAISPAGANLLALCDEVYAAAAEKFSQSELEAVRQKRDEARRALREAA